MKFSLDLVLHTILRYERSYLDSHPLRVQLRQKQEKFMRQLDTGNVNIIQLDFEAAAFSSNGQVQFRMSQAFIHGLARIGI